MPLLPPSSLYSTVRLKSATLPSFQIRNVFSLSGTSFVLPTIAPSSTLHTRVSPSQPERSLPLNNSFGSFATDGATRINDATQAQKSLPYIGIPSKLKVF